MLKTCGIGKTVSVSCARFKSHICKSRPPPPAIRPRSSCICPCLSRRRRSTLRSTHFFSSAGGVNAFAGVLFWFFFGVESWAAAHGLYRCPEYRLLSEPMSTRLLNSISSRICRQNTQFNMYTTTSKQEEGCTFKDSHPKCFITTNSDKFHREAFARGGESR